MKFWIIVGLLLMMFPLVAAAPVRDVTLNLGESILLDGKNITLARSSDESTILCINNKEIIVSKDKRVDGIYIDYRSSDEQKARFKLEYDCGDDCACDEDECDNAVCVDTFLNAINDNEDEKSDVECIENSECNDEDVCTIDSCSEGKCNYEEIFGCGVINLTETSPNDENKSGVSSAFIKSLAFFLLAIVVVLVFFSIIKLFIQKKK